MTTAFAAVAHVVPVFRPFLAPVEGALANRAGFLWQVRFFVHWSNMVLTDG